MTPDPVSDGRLDLALMGARAGRQDQRQERSGERMLVGPPVEPESCGVGSARNRRALDWREPPQPICPGGKNSALDARQERCPRVGVGLTKCAVA